MEKVAADNGALDEVIVKAAIYPSIGIARVGNSLTEWYIGPEVPDPLPLPPGSYRDHTGALKREAARFRVYGLNAAGTIVRELTDAEADIAWTVQLANTKAAWYGFQLALDIPEASAPGSTPTTLRNPLIADRKALAITPAPCTISGGSRPEQRFDDGTFMGIPVYLGSVLTDEAGRLLVLGGHGVSASYTDTIAVTFANNDTWYDDVADGPVTAKVNLAGKVLPVEPAWVVVAPPNYGPCRKSVRTMWDLMRDLAVQNHWLTKPKRPSFTNDILPIFERLAGLQWVNEGFAAGFGWKGLFDLTPATVARLASPDPANAEWRKVIANQFRTGSLDRNDTVDSWSPVPWPWLYGDAMNVPPALSPRQNSSLTNLQLSQLRQWAAGDFDADYDPARSVPRLIEDVPVAAQGDCLTKAALDFCLADAFHPGCEMTWPVRELTMYRAPFRFAHAPAGWVEPDYGMTLTYAAAAAPNGCLGPQVPGGISRWMAVPWQCDTASCRSGYDKTYDPYVPTFWPARVPNQVLTRQDYDIVMDVERPLAERQAAFARRADWDAPLDLNASYVTQINNMIAHFDHLGVVESRPGPSNGDFPTVMEVLDRHQPIGGAMLLKRTADADAGITDLSTIDKVRRLPRSLHR
ncbi:LodA/GoxA family CTQ-dependent oxidase [Rhizobium sp. BR 317]|uniref:LodA/GoxA family CTQ-dependent oxidase n=1 Tax=Rhizobium sp. BR 317 TaxID=3040015 RepID=UPI0039BF148C